jgi:DNA-binding XRE family transcriptional regulator
MRKNMEYWGNGFLVRLINFPVYEDQGWFGPDVQMNHLEKIIALRVIEKPFLLTGNELSFLRALADLSRSEAARLLGITRRTLINWEEEGDLPIRARPIMHLGLRAYFYGRIFKDAAMPAEATHLEVKLAEGPIELSFGEVEAKFGTGYLSLESRPRRQGKPAA